MDVSGSHVAVHDAAAHDDRRDVDLGVNLGAVTHDERVVAPDLPLEDPVEAHATFEVQLPLELGAAAEKRRDFGGGEGLARVHGGLK